MRTGSRAHIERLREFDRAGYDRSCSRSADRERLPHLYEDYPDPTEGESVEAQAGRPRNG